MVVDTYSIRLIEAADAHLDAIGEHRFAHPERASAPGAEAALGVRRRAEHVGSIPDHVKAVAGKCTNASAGAPEWRRHIPQWQITPRSGSAVAR
ncbi:hypothetical protein [Lysobacter soli]|uniref:hypothetical protein n=1 Tax=Lysobacter soli TaxID=453783 RepID=UPI003CF6AC59